LEPEKESPSRPPISPWPLALLGTLLFSLSYIRLRTPRQATHQRESPQGNPKIKCGNGIFKVEIVSQVPPAPAKDDDSNGWKDRTPRWKKIAEKSVALGTLGLLLVNIPLSYYTKKSADAAKESADLSKHTLEGMNAATFRINEILPTTEDYWRIYIGNFGHVAAPKLEMSYSVIHAAFPSGIPIGSVERDRFERAEVMPRTEHGENDVVRDFRTPGYNDRSVQLVNAEETFKIEGTFSYKNGFDPQLVSETFCWQTYPFPDPPTKVLWQPCDSAQAPLNRKAQAK
jgi:hypothetical protein